MILSDLSATRWRLFQHSNLRWHYFDTDAVVFSPRTGDTHLLNLIEIECLQFFLALPEADSQHICGQVAQKLGMDLDEDLREYISRLLPQLEELGLLTRVNS